MQEGEGNYEATDGDATDTRRIRCSVLPGGHPLRRASLRYSRFEQAFRVGAVEAGVDAARVGGG